MKKFRLFTLSLLTLFLFSNSFIARAESSGSSAENKIEFAQNKLGIIKYQKFENALHMNIETALVLFAHFKSDKECLGKSPAVRVNTLQLKCLQKIYKWKTIKRLARYATLTESQFNELFGSVTGMSYAQDNKTNLKA